MIITKCITKWWNTLKFLANFTFLNIIMCTQVKVNHKYIPPTKVWIGLIFNQCKSTNPFQTYYYITFFQKRSITSSMAQFDLTKTWPPSGIITTLKWDFAQSLILFFPLLSYFLARSIVCVFVCVVFVFFFSLVD